MQLHVQLEYDQEKQTNHQNCSEFCKAKASIEATEDTLEEQQTSDEACDVCDDAAKMWEEGSSLKEQEAVRLATCLKDVEWLTKVVA